MSVDGVWYSTVGSKLELTSLGTELRGTFDSVHQPGASFDLHGSVYPDEGRPDRTLSFAVAWIEDPATAKFRCVSSYSGQYHVDGETGIELLDVAMLIVNETSLSRSFTSILLGHDKFLREPPGEERERMDQLLQASARKRTDLNDGDIPVPA